MLISGVTPTPPAIRTAGLGFGRVEEKMAGRRFDIENVPFAHGVEKMGGNQAGFVPGGAGRREDFFDGDSIMIRARAVGKGVAADDRLAQAGKVDLKGNVLAGLEGRERAFVVRGEIKRGHAFAFDDLFGHLEFAAAIPYELDLFGFETAQFGGFDLLEQAFAGQRLLAAFEAETPHRSIKKRQAIERHDREQGATGRQSRIASQGAREVGQQRRVCRDHGLHFRGQSV